jgi:3'-5' exoribonuclease
VRTIRKLSDINYSQQEAVEFEATVLDVMAEGQEDAKRPMRVQFRLEESGEVGQFISWTYALLQTVKDAARSTEVVRFEALTGVFSNKQEQIRVGNAQMTGKQSTKKVIKTVDVISIKREMNAVANKYLTTPVLRDLVEELALRNDRFFEWPAATKIHHNYEGGLAIHTLSVAKHAISMWENYQGADLDIEVIVAGALLHDVGKLLEYNKDGSRTTLGQLSSHPVMGAEMVAEFYTKRGMDSYRDVKATMIKHIQLSHHERLDFGAAVQPAILEAVIVAKADAADGAYEGVRKELENLSQGDFSDKLLAGQGAKFLKWK